MFPSPVNAAAVRPLRGELLRPGQAPSQLVYPGDDAAETLHVAVKADGELLAVGSVMLDPHPRSPSATDWRIRGMATREEMRGRGLGAAMLACCEEHAHHQGGERLWCNARVGARAFYERDGFSVEGEMFEIDDIGPHYLMCKRLERAP